MRPAATLRLHDSHACAVAWLPEGGFLSAGLDGHLRAVDPRLERLPPGTPQGKGLVAVALDPGDPGRAVTGDLEGALALWDVATLSAAPPIQGHDGTAYGVLFCEAEGLITAGLDGVLRSWERPGAPRDSARELAGAAPGERVRWLVGDPAGAVRVAAGAGGPLRLWRHGALHEWSDLGRAVAGLALHPSGEVVAAVSFAGHVELRQVPDGAVLGRSPAEYAQAVCPLAFHPDGSRLAVGGDGRVRVLDAATLEVVAEDRFPAETPSLAWSPDGAALAVPGTDGRVRVYQL